MSIPPVDFNHGLLAHAALADLGGDRIRAEPHAGSEWHWPSLDWTGKLGRSIRLIRSGRSAVRVGVWRGWLADLVRRTCALRFRAGRAMARACDRLIPLGELAIGHVSDSRVT